MDIVDKMIERAERDREYARLNYPEQFGKITRRIDHFISRLKAERLNEGKSLPLEVGTISS
jgi:hypothetical protein